jgi:hypothetical protein
MAQPDKRTNPNDPIPNNIQENKDEIMKFQSGRYVSASESCWRTLNFPLHDQNPRTERLPVHLENKQPVTFVGNQQLSEIVNKNNQTQLTKFFELNSKNVDARKLCYWELPQFFSWNQSKKKWKKRQK